MSILKLMAEFAFLVALISVSAITAWFLSKLADVIERLLNDDS